MKPIALELETPVVYVRPYVPTKVGEFENDVAYLDRESAVAGFVGREDIYGPEGLSTRTEAAIAKADAVSAKADLAQGQAEEALAIVTERTGVAYVDQKFQEGKAYTQEKIRENHAALQQTFSNPNLLSNSSFRHHSGYDAKNSTSFTNPVDKKIFDFFTCSGVGTVKPHAKGAIITGQITFSYTLSSEDFLNVQNKTVTLSYSFNDSISKTTFVALSPIAVNKAFSAGILNWVKLEIGEAATKYSPSSYEAEGLLVEKKESERIGSGQVAIYGTDWVGTLFIPEPKLGYVPNGYPNLPGVLLPSLPNRITELIHPTSGLFQGFSIYSNKQNTQVNSVHLPINAGCVYDYSMSYYAYGRNLNTGCAVITMISANTIHSYAHFPNHVLQLTGRHWSYYLPLVHTTTGDVEVVEKTAVLVPGFKEKGVVYHTGYKAMLFGYRATAKMIQRVNMVGQLRADIIPLTGNDLFINMYAFGELLYVLVRRGSASYILKAYTYEGVLKTEVVIGGAEVATALHLLGGDEKGIQISYSGGFMLFDPQTLAITQNITVPIPIAATHRAHFHVESPMDIWISQLEPNKPSYYKRYLKGLRAADSIVLIED